MIMYKFFGLSIFIILTSLFLVPNSASAATETISYLYEDCSGKPTPCYTSMAAWETDRNRDLVALDEQETLQIDGTWINPDTSYVNIAGWTTSANNYIKIYTTTAARHDGKWNNAKYRLEVGDGETPAWCTIQYAVNTINPGDTVYIRAGIYNEQVTISSLNGAGIYSVIQNYQNELVVINANGYISGIQINDGVHYIKLIGLEIKNASCYGIGAWYGIESTFIEIQDCNIHDNGSYGAGCHSGASYWYGGIVLHGPDNVTVDNCEIHHNKPVGLGINGSTSFDIKNNFIYFNPGRLSQGDNYGVWIAGGSSNGTFHDNSVYFCHKAPRISNNSDGNTFFNNILAYNGYAGFEVNSGCDNNVFRNNIFAFNGTFGGNPKEDNSDNTQYYHNIFYRNGLNHIRQNAPGDTAINTRFENNIFMGGAHGGAVERDSDVWGIHDYNNYYNLANNYATGGALDGNQIISEWIGLGNEEPNSVNLDPQFDDPSSFDFDINNSSLLNTGNNPDGYGYMIGLSNNFVNSVPNNRIFPYIPLTVLSANYDISGASGTIDRQESTYSLGTGWVSNTNGSGWIIYQVNGGLKNIKWIGLSAGSKIQYYSPDAFRIQVSTTGTADGDFTTVLSTNRVDNINDVHTSMGQWYEFPNTVSARYVRLMIDSSFQDNIANMTDVRPQVIEFYAIGPEGSDAPPPIPGDFNNDGSVNSMDWSIMNSAWFTSDATSDLNSDGMSLFNSYNKN